MDMIVDDKVLVEIKATENLHPAGTAQLFGYRCSTKLEVGLLRHLGREASAHRGICENRYERHGGAKTWIATTPTSQTLEALTIRYVTTDGIIQDFKLEN